MSKEKMRVGYKYMHRPPRIIHDPPGASFQRLTPCSPTTTRIAAAVRYAGDAAHQLLANSSIRSGFVCHWYLRAESNLCFGCQWDVQCMDEQTWVMRHRFIAEIMMSWILQGCVNMSKDSGWCRIMRGSRFTYIYIWLHFSLLIWSAHSELYLELYNWSRVLVSWPIGRLYVWDTAH